MVASSFLYFVDKPEEGKLLSWQTSVLACFCVWGVCPLFGGVSLPFACFVFKKQCIMWLGGGRGSAVALQLKLELDLDRG